MNESITYKAYKIPMFNDILLRGNVRSLGYFEKGATSYKYFSIEFDESQRPSCHKNYNISMEVERSWTYFNYELYSDLIVIMDFNPEFDSFSEEENKIILKTKFIEQVFCLDYNKRVIKKDEYNIWETTGKPTLTDECYYDYLPGSFNVKSIYNYRDNLFSYRKSVDHYRKTCNIMEKEYDASKRCIAQKFYSFNFKESDIGNLDNIKNMITEFNGELYLHNGDNVTIFPFIKFKKNKDSISSQYNCLNKILVDLNGNILQNGECNLEGNFTGSYSKYYYDSKGNIIETELFDKDLCYYTQKNIYDENGNLILFDEGPENKWEYKYEWDENGNWIIRNDFLNGEKINNVRREIKYY